MPDSNLRVRNKRPLPISASPARHARVTNAGPDVVYYKAGRDVSASSKDGDLAVNESLNFESGTRWFLSAGGSRLFVAYTPDSTTDMATQAELDAVSSGGASAAELEAHEAATAAVHGIADTSKIAEDVDVAVEEAARKAADEAEEEARKAVSTKLDNLAVTNVKDFGAKGDGETDDTTAIQEAIDSVLQTGAEDYGDEGSAAGGIVYLPAGTYLVSDTLLLGTCTTLIGAGQGSTWITLKEGVNKDLLQSDGFSTLAGGNENKGPYRFGIMDLTLSGGGGAESRGLAIYGRRYFIDRVRIDGFQGGGLYSEWYTGGIEMEARISDLTVRGCGGAGIDWRGPHDSTFSHCYVENHEGEKGIWVHEGSSAGPSFHQCHVYGTGGHKIAWQIDQNAYLTDCQGEGASDIQLHVNAAETTVLGGHYFGTGEVGDESTGIKIGTEGENFASDLRINTRASKCKVCVDFDQGGSRSSIVVSTNPRAGGTHVEGEPDPDSNVQILTGSSSTSVVQPAKNNREIAPAEEIDVPNGVNYLTLLGGEGEVKKITGAATGRLLVIRREGGNVTIVDGENLNLAGNWTGNWGVTLTLIGDGSSWFEVSRSAN